MTRFSVTYDIVTPESAEQGDVVESGFICQDATLRDAFAELNNTRTRYVGGVECVEANDSHVDHARWITVYNSREFYTGACESRSIHIPDHVTAASRRRIARLCGIRC